MRYFLIGFLTFGLGTGLDAREEAVVAGADHISLGMVVFVGVCLLVLGICIAYIKHRYAIKTQDMEKRAEGLELSVKKQTRELQQANRELKNALDQHAASEDALRKSEEANQAILRALPDQIIRIDRSGRFLDFRINMAHQPSSVLDDVGARCLDDMTSQSFVSQMKEHMVKTLATGQMQGFEYETELGNGTVFHEVRVVREGADAVLAIVRDVSSRKQMEKRIVQLERQQALGELSHGVSHNFNNILTGILGPAQLLHKKAQDDATSKASEMIINSAKRASELVKSLSSAVHKNDSGKLYAISLHDVVIDVIGKFAANLGDDILIHSELETDLPIQGTWDGLIVILEHLLHNAAEALPEGGNIHVRTHQAGANIELVVADDGVGMTEEIMRRVFEPFFTTKKEVGPGLGLTTVHGLITHWGGDIAVESQVGQGARFCVTLPTYQEEDMVLPEPQMVDEDRSLRVLIVDDEPIVRFTLGEYFEHYHSVDTAKNGQEALDMFEEGRYDVALIDLSMPFMPGNEVAAKMKEIDANLSTVLITGVPLKSKDVRLDCFDFCVTKPFTDLEKLHETLNQLCNKHTKVAV